MYKDYEIKLNAILDSHKGVQKIDLNSVKEVKEKYKTLIRASETFADLFERWNIIGKEIGSVSKMQKIIKNFADETKAMQSQTNKYQNELDELEDSSRKLEEAAKKLGVDTKDITIIKQARNLIKNDIKSIGVVKKALKGKYK